MANQGSHQLHFHQLCLYLYLPTYLSLWLSLHSQGQGFKFHSEILMSQVLPVVVFFTFSQLTKLNRNSILLPTFPHHIATSIICTTMQKGIPVYFLIQACLPSREALLQLTLTPSSLFPRNVVCGVA